MTRLNLEFIKAKAERLLISMNVPVDDAQILVDTLISADLCGVSTHGIRMLPAYANKISKGEFSFEKPRIIKHFPSFSIIDANNTIGAVSASFAVDLALEHARISGIHTVFSRNSNTFGPGFYYAEKIASGGMIGFVCSNSPAAMPAANGLEAMLGTNPISFALPTKSYDSIVIDMATSVVAKSRFGVAKARGEKLEPGWALDKFGNPTLVKGYGIAMMIDILAGLLSGAEYLNKVGKFYSTDGSCMNVGHMFTAYNPELLCDGDFLSDADKYVECLKNSKSQNNKEIIIPGDDRKKMRLESSKKGIEISDDVIEKLELLFEEKLV